MSTDKIILGYDNEGQILGEKAENEANLLYKEQTSHKKQGQFLRAAVQGGLDGTTILFAMISGVIGAGLSTGVLIILGLTGLLASSLALGLGQYLSNKSEVEFKQAEREREKNSEDIDWRSRVLNIEKIFIERGLNQVDARTLAHIYAKNKDLWMDIVMVEELGGVETKIDYKRTGVIGTAAFLIMGLIPLLPFWIAYIFDSSISQQAPYFISLGMSAMALLILGAIRINYTHKKLIKSAFETLAFGAVPSALAYFVGSAMSSVAK